MKWFNYRISYRLAEAVLEKYKDNHRDPRVLAKSRRVEDLPLEHFDILAFCGDGHMAIEIYLSENDLLLIPLTSTVRANIPYIAMPSFRHKKLETDSCSKVDFDGKRVKELSLNFAPKYGVIHNTDDKRGKLRRVNIREEEDLTLSDKLSVFYMNSMRETDRVNAYNIGEGKVFTFSRYDLLAFTRNVDQRDHTPYSRGYYLKGEYRKCVQDRATVLAENVVVDSCKVNGFEGANHHGTVLKAEKDRYVSRGVQYYEDIKGCPKNLVDSKLAQVDKKSVASAVNYKNGIGRLLSNRPNLLDSMVDDRKFNLMNYCPGAIENSRRQGPGVNLDYLTGLKD